MLVGVLVNVLAVGVMVVFWRCFGGILVFIEDIVMDIMVVVFFGLLYNDFLLIFY